ncbi:metallopeptidase family protein (plasmid) [Paracoccus sp. TK19116]|uniref:Metallopeptidase family protein n=1 Tax=Paracoccus albicereus TaxID=2922394 RepID=A0ABT1MMT4_9RHOB|nr:metallopeptidase family protein [Paracoccus albicereus]MCQ0969094.1 metallopeptidase family protein [Paracoccus albicereus]
MSDWNGVEAPGNDDFLAMARDALATLPAEFAGHAQDVAIRIEDFAGEEVLDELQIDDPFELTGLYDGIPVTEKSVVDQPAGPDIIWLFRRPILDEWASRGDVALDDLVKHIVIHELAHHFGWTDEQIARIDRWWE